MALQAIGISRDSKRRTTATIKIPTSQALWRRNPGQMDHETERESAWNNDDNWWLIYFRKRDPRRIVPKRRNKGWTFNLGHNKGALAFLSIMIGPLLVMISVCIAAIVFSCK